MIKVADILKEKFIMRIIILAKRNKQRVYLVGGFLRDRWLKRQKQNWDLDFAVDFKAIDLARTFAKETKSGFVVLDRQHGCARVVLEGGTLDFADFRGKNLKEDLLHRDFTINTLALPLCYKSGTKRPLLDYYNARGDLEKGIIRMTSDSSFEEDPLRILRAFSLSALLNFKIEKTTLMMAEKQKDRLKDVSCERIRDELFKIFSVPYSYKYISALDNIGILSLVIPQIELMRNLKQGSYHHLDVWGHSLETLRQYELLIAGIENNQIKSYINEILAAERTRNQIIKLVCLLHDVGKPQAYRIKEKKTIFYGHERIGRDISEAIVDRLRLSTKEKFAIETMIFWHLRPGYLADNIILTERAKFRYFRDAADEAISILLLSIADQRATRGPLANPKSRHKHEKIVFGLIEEYFKRKKENKVIRLITGDDLIKTLRLKPSPLFRIILDEIEQSQAEGKVKTKQQALALAKRIAEENQDDKRVDFKKPKL